MSRFLFWLACFFAPLLHAQDPLPAIGQWREHLPYAAAIDLARGAERLWCATPYSLFSVRYADNEVERYSRITGLSETGVNLITSDDSGEKLLVAYANSNIDILYRNDVYPVPGLKRSLLTGDKTIYQATARGDLFYLSTGLGIVVVNASRYEIRESWFIGNNGQFVKVNGFTVAGGFFWAATEEGLKRIPQNDPNPANHARWENMSGLAGLPGGPCRQVMGAGSRLLAQTGDTLWSWNGSQWSLFYQDGWPIVSTRVSENKIVICQLRPAGTSRVVFLNEDGTSFRLLANTGAVSFPRAALIQNGTPWVADQFAGLSRFNPNDSYVNWQPNSPLGIAGGDLQVDNGTVYAAAGSVNDNWNYQFNSDGLYRFREGSWENINRVRYPVLDSLLDFITLTTDPRDGSFWAGSFGGGLVQVKPGPSFEIYKQNQLGETVGDPGSYRVAGLCFDRDQHLWIANYGAARPLRVRLNDGSWQSLSLPFTLTDNALTQVLAGENGFIWMVSPKGNGLLVLDPNGSPANTGDDRWKRLTAGAGNGNLPSTEISCLAFDRTGQLWVGTSNGIGVIPCPDQVLDAGGCEAYWPVVNTGSLAGFLFRGQFIRAIAVDGADRKWVATANGVYLVSPAGDRVISRFTEDNSPLLSSDVRKLAIDGKTGEVFFATAKGICSYRGTATEGSATHQTVQVFPNPVPPGYSGIIAIRGLAENSIVKITETDGRLVYQTRALGGQATWDGRNYRGQAVASGAYLVLVSKEGERETTAAKIFIIAK